jgi:thioredoxin reductase
VTGRTRDEYDVVVVGGGAAGLSGALTLARARRAVLVVDEGRPRNAPATAMHGYLGRDGLNPAALLEAGRAEVRGYGGEIVAGRAVAASRQPDGFTIGIEGGDAVRARRLLVTTGLVDELPDVPGVRERWGRDVLHCPYCHGWEVRDQAVGVLATGPQALHQALLFRQWTSDLTLLLHTAPEPGEADLERLAARGIRVVAGEVAELEIAGDRLVGVRLASGEQVPLHAVVVRPRFVARPGVLTSLGIEPAEHGADYAVAADATGLTELPGVWVAGNVTDLAAPVISAASAGTRAAMAINADLVEEDTARAVEARRPGG